MADCGMKVNVRIKKIDILSAFHVFDSSVLLQLNFTAVIIIFGQVQK